MKSHDFAFSGRPVLVSLQRLSYNCLDVAFSTYNETWREMRKISTLHLLAPRETMQKCTIDGYKIEAGTLVYINAWSIGRDSEIWENPNEFSPERFLGSEVDVRGRDPELIPFGIGRRGCPAISIGMTKVEICLANLLNAFDWELPYGMKGEDVTFNALPGMAMQKKSALCAVAKPHVNGY